MFKDTDEDTDIDTDKDTDEDKDIENYLDSIEREESDINIIVININQVR